MLGFMGGVIPVETGEIRHVSEAVREVLERGGVVVAEDDPQVVLIGTGSEVSLVVDAHEALADLFAYSLASRVAAAGGQAKEPAFAVHRLVQEFTQKGKRPIVHQHRAFQFGARQLQCRRLQVAGQLPGLRRSETPGAIGDATERRQRHLRPEHGNCHRDVQRRDFGSE